MDPLGDEIAASASQATSTPVSEAYLHETVCTALAVLPGYELLAPWQVTMRPGLHGNWFVECSMPSMTHEEEAASKVVARLQARYHLE